MATKITIDEAEIILAHGCGVCGIDENLVIDHDHDGVERLLRYLRGDIWQSS